MSDALPVIAGDLGTWGTLLNEWLLVAHNADGTLADTPWLIYASDTPAEGSLIFSRAGTAGTDTYGNKYLAGTTSYTDNSGTFCAVNLYLGTITFQYASAAGGPYTTDVTISDTTGSNFKIASTNEDWQLKFQTNLMTLDSVTSHGTDLFINHGGNLRTNHPGSPGTAETWQTATLLNGWSGESGSKVNYQRVASPPNSVMVSCNLVPGTVADGTIFATLPYGPATNKWDAAYTNNIKSGSTTYEGGGVRFDTGGNLACYGINAGGGTQFGFNHTWPLDV